MLLELIPGLGGGTRPPSLTELQSAYENAAREPGSRHLPGLVILGSSCDDLREDKFFCQIGYKLSGEDEQRVYLDVASVQKAPEAGWVLVTGLCRN